MEAATSKIKLTDNDDDTATDVDTVGTLHNDLTLNMHENWTSHTNSAGVYDCGSVRAPMQTMPQFSLSMAPGTTRNNMKPITHQTSCRGEVIPSFGIEKGEVPVWAQPSYRDEQTPKYNMVSPMNNYSYREDYPRAGGVTNTCRSSTNPDLPLFVSNRFGFNDIMSDIGIGSSMDMNMYMSPMRGNTDVYLSWGLDHIQSTDHHVLEDKGTDWSGTPLTATSNNTGTDVPDAECEQVAIGFASLGSAHHPLECRPCAFYFTKGCINGADCRFCHEWHPPKKKKPMKEQKNLMIIARPDGKIEFMRCTMMEALRVL